MDPTDSSNTSELGSLSDSDWLDVASSKASEDNDSADGNSDLRPLSRHSYHSRISSTDGSSIIAWEGYVEDSGDEEGPHHPFPSPIQRSPYSPRVALVSPSPEDDPVEDQRVRDALDQSMMSTLSSSRSGSFGKASIHTTRDLRLSFPDPISSSRDALNRSYEHVESPELTPLPSVDDELPTQEAIAIAPPSEEGSSVAPEIFCNTDASSVGLPSSMHDLHIILYGFSTDIKWDFVNQLFDRMCLGTGLRLSKSTGYSAKRELELCSIDETSRRLVVIIDKTESSDIYPNPDLSFRGPSLGILFLPSSIGSLPAHTRYLPLIPPSAYMYDTPSGQETVRKTARDRWEKLGVSRKRLLFNNTRSSPIMENETLLQLDPKHIALAFESLLPGIFPVPKEQDSVAFKLTGQLPVSPWILQTLFALMCGLIGCFVGIAIGPSQIPGISIITSSTASISGTPWLPQSSINESAPATWGPTPTEMASALPASLKDFALTVFNPPGSLSQIESHTPQPSISDGFVQPDCPSYGLIRSSKDIISLPFERDKALSIVSSNGKGKSRETLEDVLYDLSLQIARSVTDLLDMDYIQAIAESLGQEVKEVLAIIEELVREIKVHGTMAWENPLDTIEAIRKHFRDKHNNARRNARRKAKKLGELGERFFVYATEAWNERKERAREGAVAVNKRMFKSEKWLAHEKELYEARRGQVPRMGV